jgi:hypothetical protein
MAIQLWAADTKDSGLRQADYHRAPWLEGIRSPAVTT